MDMEWIHSESSGTSSYIPKMWYENRLNENGTIKLATGVEGMAKT